MPKKTFASLFTGGGLADVGALQAGYELLWGIELDEAIAAVANANLPHRDTVHSTSVIGFDWRTVQRPDHLHMSPPCQDYSVAKTSGKIGNDNDAIADACVEALDVLRPDTVTLENVEGYKRAPGFQRIVDWLYGAGYWVDWQILNSADFGVPQTRRRLFLRAVRGGFPGPLPQPVKWRGWYEAIEDLISDLPEAQFAAWQLERLPDELKTMIVHNNDMRTMPIRAESQPMFTVMAGSGIKNPSTAPKAYLVESKNANQQRGDGVRESHEPHTTVITDHKPSHQPKVLLVNSAFPGSNGKKHYTADEPSFTTDTTSLGRMKALLVGGGGNRSEAVTTVEGGRPSFAIAASSGKQAQRAYIGTSDESREEFEYQERLRWAEEDAAKPVIPSGRVVRMTPRCLARFQSLPDWYRLPEKTALACRIIGNGVPCLMMQRVLESLEVF